MNKNKNTTEFRSILALALSDNIVRSLLALILLALTGLVSLIVMGSCSPKDINEYYQSPLTPDGTPIENPGQVSVSLNGLPAEDYAIINLAPATGTPYQLQHSQPVDVEAGHYAITAISYPARIILPQNIEVVPARTTTDDDKTAITGGLLRLIPTADGEVPCTPRINGNTDIITILPNATVTPSLTLRPLTREVTVNGLLQGLDPSAVSQFRATLCGVGNERDISKPFAGTTDNGARNNTPETRSAATESYYVTTTFSPAADGTFSLVFRLLGIDTSLPQRLRLTLTYRDSEADDYVYEVDVTPLLSGFNNGPAAQPAVLNATLSFGVDGVTGSITGWTPGLDEDITGQ